MRAMFHLSHCNKVTYQDVVWQPLKCPQVQPTNKEKNSVTAHKPLLPKVLLILNSKNAMA